MKTKLSKILGVGLVLAIVASLTVFAVPAASEEFDPTPGNMWVPYTRAAGPASGWFIQGPAAANMAIRGIGPIAESPINIEGQSFGALYAYVTFNDGSGDIFKSVDGGRSWTTSTHPFKYAGGAVVDMVCSSLHADHLYVTDGNYVYKSADGFVSFSVLAKASLEELLAGECDCAIDWFPITSIDVGYNANDNPLVFIGVTETYDELNPPPCQHTGPPSILYLAEADYPVSWYDLELNCYGCGGYVPWAVAATPDFADTGEVVAVVSQPLTILIADTDAATVTISATPDGGAIRFTDLSGTNVSYSGSGVTNNGDGTFSDTLNPNETTTFSTGAATGDVAITVWPECDGNWTWAVTSGTAVLCGGTYVVSTAGIVCNWVTEAQLLKDCVTPFEIGPYVGVARCDATDPDGPTNGACSRIGFPDDWSESRTLFVGVVGIDYDGTTTGLQSFGGDVYSVTAPACLDLNVAGFSTGCVGLECSTDIISLDVDGNTEDASLIAGLYDLNQLSYVFYSYTGGWEWDHCDKRPSGNGPTYVLWVGDLAAAATDCCEAAFSLSCGDEAGEYFNNVSLIATDIDFRLDLDHAPGYILDTSIMFEVTACYDCCGSTNTTSVWRYDGTYVERVWVSTIFDDIPAQWVKVSPDADTTQAVFVANSGFDIFRSTDYGCSWRLMPYPCTPKPSISAWEVVDEDTVLCAGNDAYAGTIYRTTTHGSRPWDEFAALTCAGTPAGDGIDFDLSLPRNAESDILFGDDESHVFLSQDLGATWTEVADVATGIFDASMDTYVQFDPGYGVSGDPGENMIYAAAGDTVGRCDLNFEALLCMQDWIIIKGNLCQASGIDAHGDTALYVSDAGEVVADGMPPYVDGTLAVRYDCDSAGYGVPSGWCTCDFYVYGSTFDAITGIPCNEPLEIVAYNLNCQIIGVTGSIVVKGLVSGYYARIYISELFDGCYWCEPQYSAVEVISGDIEIVCPYEPSDCPSGVYRTLNPMAPVVPVPLVEWEFLANPGASLQHPPSDVSGYPDPSNYGAGWDRQDGLWLTRRAPASNVLWCLDAASPTTVWVWEDPLANPVTLVAPACGAQLVSPSSVTLEWNALDAATEYEINLYRYCAQCPNEMMPETVPNSADTCAIIADLLPGTTYYWQVRVATGHPYLSKWSELCEFTTALGPIPNLCSPPCGGEDIILTTNFSWDEVVGAAGYELQIVAAGADGTADFTGATTFTTDVNALASIPGLEYSTVYYWRVRAVTAGVPGAWAVCIFTTMGEPEEPLPPADLVVDLPDVEEITPTWLWVLIGIGAALTVAVIILIVTTRRVP